MKNSTEIVMIIDKSGSMAPYVNDTLGGLNNFIKEQKAVPGDAKLTIVFFDTEISTVLDGIDLQEVKEITTEAYKPNGGTALLKAIADTIDRIENKYSLLHENSKPDKVIFVIQTDGEENASPQPTYTKNYLAEKVRRKHDADKWEFIFLGANMDAFSEGTSMGFTNNIMYSQAKSSRALYTNTASLVETYRTTGSIDEEAVAFATQELK